MVLTLRPREVPRLLIGDYLLSHQPWRPLVDGNWNIGRDITSERPLTESAAP